MKRVCLGRRVFSACFAARIRSNVSVLGLSLRQRVLNQDRKLFFPFLDVCDKYLGLSKVISVHILPFSKVHGVFISSPLTEMKRHVGLSVVSRHCAFV